MPNKMYYSEEEATAKLGVDTDGLNEYVRQKKLRLFKDGTRNMYMASEVDALAPPPEVEQEVELSPVADTAAVSETDQAKPAGKEDTVITAEGISIFDDEDLEIESADPMAKTQIAQSITDPIAIDGIGAGSGLLDLTHESDDTSLGAVIDRIDLDETEGETPPSPYGEPSAVGEPTVISVAEAPETIDAASGVFNGLLVGSAIVALVIGAVALAAGTGVVPNYLSAMKENMTAVFIGVIVLMGVCGVAGMLIGKSIANKQAMQNAGG